MPVPPLARRQAFWKKLSEGMRGIPACDSKSRVITVLSEIIWRVSGYHQHIGNVAVAGTNPMMISDHLRKPRCLPKISDAHPWQLYSQAAALQNIDI